MILSGRSFSLEASHFWPLVLSSLFGIVVGDFFLFAAMLRRGPRRTNILSATNAPIAACLGWFILGEGISFEPLLSLLLGFLGVVLAIIYGNRRDLAHIWEAVTPPRWVGLMGILALAWTRCLKHAACGDYGTGNGNFCDHGISFVRFHVTAPAGGVSAVLCCNDAVLCCVGDGAVGAAF